MAKGPERGSVSRSATDLQVLLFIPNPFCLARLLRVADPRSGCARRQSQTDATGSRHVAGAVEAAGVAGGAGVHHINVAAGDDVGLHGGPVHEVGGGIE